MDDSIKTSASSTHIGKVIGERMRERHITVIDLSRILDCSRTNVYKILGKRNIDTALLMKLSQIIGFDFFKIYTDEVEAYFKSHPESRR